MPYAPDCGSRVLRGWNAKVIDHFRDELTDIFGHNWAFHEGIPKVIDWNMWEKPNITKRTDTKFKNLLKLRK